ncbi:hypothetical protein MKW92_047606 [Papaver armeniacum]|nr:hypothetical protein MKW92_047606 [Papaver armeniacum]
MAQGNSYEEARKQRLEDNKRRFQELGVLKIANSLSDVTKDKKKTPRKYTLRSKTAPLNPDLMRRSSRPRNQVAYSQGTGRKKCETRYVSTRVATKEERNDALKRAMSFQSGLLSRNPSFVKSMSRSQVAGCFTLDLPLEISNTHLPEKSKLRIVLENEVGSLYIVHYNGRSKLSDGWRAFSRDHKLDDGDALVIELIEPTRFKVYIFKVSSDVSEVKVDEPKKARESKSSKTVDAEQICQKL